MPPRKFLTYALTLTLVAAFAAVAACGGGDDDDTGGQTGIISDPNNVPTSTPWGQAPDVVILDPNDLRPLPPSDNGGSIGGGPTTAPVAGEPGVCGPTYTVEAGDITVDIADKCGVTVEGIEAANPDIDIRSLSIGQVLIMPVAEVVDPEEVVPDEAAPEETTGE